jgi:hypothetical protein
VEEEEEDDADEDGEDEINEDLLDDLGALVRFLRAYMRVLTALVLSRCLPLTGRRQTTTAAASRTRALSTSV